MKSHKIKLFTLYILVVFISTSCEDMLNENPNSSYDKNNFFSSEAKAEMAVMGIYNSISSNNHYGWYEMAGHGSDDTYYTARTNSDNTIHDMIHYNTKSTNEWVESLWQLKYEGIDRANMTIDGIQNMKGYKNNEKLKALEAEARFLRAFLAFDLVKYWGDVPFKTNYTSSYDDAFGERVNREIIYDQIIEDLDFAKTNCEWNDGSSTSERVSQGAARAFLMRVYLQRAGYSLQQNGKQERPSDETRKLYFNAVLEEWDAIVNNGFHNFHEEGYEMFFKNFSKGVVTNKESIFEIPFFHAPNLRNGSAWGIYNGPLVAEPVGLSPSESNNYMGRANGFFIVVPEWKDFYEECDLRRDINICTYRYNWDSQNKKHIKQERQAGSWYPGKWRREWMSQESQNKNINYADINYCVVRYSDVVLMAAEAYNEIGETNMAWELLNKIRERAGASVITSKTLKEYKEKHPKLFDLTYFKNGGVDDFREVLYWERGFELSYEGVRKFDLIRWGILGKALRLFGEKTIVNKKEVKPYPACDNFTEGKNELLPIPLKEIQSNSKLKGTNNPGY